MPYERGIIKTNYNNTTLANNIKLLETRLNLTEESIERIASRFAAIKAKLDKIEEMILEYLKQKQ